ncbi:LysR family transcriptional regulator [Pseudooceanicola sp. 216_PA32_1]|uniref:LysR family transcriptional regulator n=1 Tax=Pseudooceanicola pacificus TaxID=2676438 RepID=A0A844WAG8_9RHOB|nr:LysR family transcriptional regulator [Pseudooceanicola pacificus]MWB77638.1 LysR family transcriptional regulator [Pseudooceanicola pacificus]
MRARQLEVFCAVMRAGTVTAAARDLNISQPALSQILLHTEDELGLTLFERIKGRLHATEIAHELYPEAERVFAGLEALRRHAIDLRDGRVGLVRMAASAPPAMSFLPDAIAEFRQDYSSVALRSHIAPVASMTQMVLSGDISIAVSLSDAAHPSLNIEKLGEVPMVCILNEGHRLTAHKEMTLSDLADETLISYRANTLPGHRLMRVAQKEGIEFSPEIEVDASISVLPFVQNGLGVAVVDGLMPWHSFPGIAVRRFLPETQLPVTILTNREHQLSPAHEGLLAAIRKSFKNKVAQL